MVAKVLGLALLAALCTSAEAIADSMTWRFRNQSEDALFAQLHSRSRVQAWPDADEIWRVPPNGLFYDQPISCATGEDICYGAWNDDKSLKWGVGPAGKDGCENCCYRCGEGNTATVSLFIRGRSRLAGISVTGNPAGDGVSGAAIYVLSWQKSSGEDGIYVSGKVRLVNIVGDRKASRGVFAFDAACTGADPVGVEIKGGGPFVPVNPEANPPDPERLDYDLWWAACRGQFSKF